MFKDKRTAFLTVALIAAVGACVLLFLRFRTSELTLTFTREELQQRIAEKFPFDQRLLVFTITYSDPVLELHDGSDRIGIGLVATAKLGEGRIGVGRVDGDWQVRYDPTEGAFFFDDPNINRFEIQGLPTSAQATVASVAKPLIQEYLRRVPVYRLKPGDLRQDLARSVLKSVSVKHGRLVVTVGPG